MQVSQTRFLLDCVVSLLLVSSVFALSDLSDIPGRFCEGRRVPCCDARQDACSVPIRGTLCYCDQFCDRPFNDDCCPDYQYVCLNRTRPLPPLPDFSTTPRPTPRPTRSCWYKQQFYPEGYTFRDNCNRCLCEYQCRGRDCRGEMVCERNRCLVDPDLLTEVNQGRYGGWRAANYSEFWGRTLEEGLTLRLGTKHSRKRAYSMRTVKDVFDRERVRARLRYDLRSERPDMISTPLDQGWCAADWVISTVQIATDRLMMMSKGRDHTVLSPQHLLSCNKNQQGCRGGRLTKAWIFINKFGLVPDNCYRWVGNQTNCAIAKHKEKTYISTPCADGNSFGPLHRTGPVYRISNEPEAIMNEILVSGPVQATMKVSQDFFVYRSGIYQCPRASRSSKASSYHSVRIVGWGEEVQQGRLVQYWIVSNSWGTWWGEGGFFRIVRGKDECEIESLILASWANPILPKEDPFMPMPEKNNIINNFLSKF